jgi:acyl-lipid omega-6 desaturase (Delta-12 desaturase)
MTVSTVKLENLAHPPVHLKEILQTLPSECFQKQRFKAWSTVFISIVMVSLGYYSIALAPWFLLPIAWIFSGTALTGFFVIAHDCGHRSFAKRRWVNDLVGHVLLLPLIYPFHSWRILHNRHHLHTNKLNVDNAWQPFQPEFYESTGWLVRKGYETMRGRFWWLASIVHWFGIHFSLSKFPQKDHSQVKLSIATVVIFAAIAFPVLIATTGVWGFTKFWLLPWLVYHFWMSTFTLVHHTDADIAFVPAEQWNAVQSQLSGTVHCNYPRWIEFLCHNISVHIPHHISTAIPSYNLWMAYRSLQNDWGSYLHPERRFSWSLMKQITDRCHLYDPDRCYQSFQDYRQKPHL